MLFIPLTLIRQFFLAIFALHKKNNMKAIGISGYGGTEVLEIVELPVPEINEDEVLVKVFAASVNPVDWKTRRGNLKFLTGKKFPFIPGVEVAGVVERIGSNVKIFRPGQRVYAGLSYMGGGYAEYIKTHWEKVFLIPDNTGFPEACTYGVAGVTAYQGFVHHGNIQEGMHILVNGASGGVGTYAVQIAKILGAKVTAVCSGKNFELVKSLGADELIDYTQKDATKNLNTYDIILDAVGTIGFLKARKALRRKGKYVNTLPRPKLFFWQILTSLTAGKKASGVILKMYRDDLEWVRDQVALGRIRVIIDRSYPLEEAIKAHEYSETLRAKGKIVLIAGN